MPYNLNMENIITHNMTRDMLPSISSTILHVRYSEHANSKSVQSSPPLDGTCLNGWPLRDVALIFSFQTSCTIDKVRILLKLPSHEFGVCWKFTRYGLFYHKMHNWWYRRLTNWDDRHQKLHWWNIYSAWWLDLLLCFTYCNNYGICTIFLIYFSFYSLLFCVKSSMMAGAITFHIEFSPVLGVELKFISLYYLGSSW